MEFLNYSGLEFASQIYNYGFTRPTSAAKSDPTVSEWRYVSKKHFTRITLTDGHTLESSNTLTDSIASICPGYHDDNQKAYKSLFAAIHNEYPVQSEEVQELLKNDLANGKPLSSQLVNTVLKFANLVADFCMNWNNQALILSPRTDLGKQFIQELTLLVNNKLVSANALSVTDKLRVLNNLKKEFEHEKTIHPELKSRIHSLLNLEIERLNFEMNAQKCPQLANMINPANDCWRLAMDGKQQTNGMHHFENEKGYMQGMLSGLNLMLTTLDQPLTADLYVQLHDTAVNEVYERDNLEKPMSKGYAENAVSFNLVKWHNCTNDGLAEFRNKSGVEIQKTVQGKKLVAHYPADIAVRVDGENFVTTITKTTQQICHEHVTQVIDTYNTELKEAQIISNPIEKETAILTCIAKCCQDLDQHHVFSDGNIRTAVFLTMNKLLLQNNLSPVIMDEPNVLDMFSLKQIVALMREGQKTFATLTKPKTPATVY